MIGAITAGLYGGAAVALPGNYYSIATVTSTGSSPYISFTSIPSGYKHLQLRFMVRDGYSGSGRNNMIMEMNGDTTAANYYRHVLQGDGASASAGSGNDDIVSSSSVANGSAANIFGVGVIDILDYSSTAKYKTVRTLSGADFNGSGAVMLNSELWNNTAAVNALRFFAGGVNNWVSGTTIALYGVL